MSVQEDAEDLLGFQPLPIPHPRPFQKLPTGLELARATLEPEGR